MGFEIEDGLAREEKLGLLLRNGRQVGLGFTEDGSTAERVTEAPLAGIRAVEVKLLCMCVWIHWLKSQQLQDPRDSKMEVE